VNLLFVVLSSQLLYYLLIAQTGVVGAFDSHIHDLYPLPIGGIVGAILCAYWKHHGIKTELYFLFGAQVMVSWFYPNYSLGMIFVLGFIVGYTTPLLLFAFREQGYAKLSLGLAIAYAVGTALYTYPYESRGSIAIVLPVISIAALYFSALGDMRARKEPPLSWTMIAMMMIWIFADSALFETLSRSGVMDIWSQHTLLIIVSHVLGVRLAYLYGKPLMRSGWTIVGLFFGSYAAYYTQQPLLLAVIYPIAISYYNVLVFRELTQMKSVRAISIAMIGVGWVAATTANFIALEHFLWIVPVVLISFVISYPFYLRRNV
jgi:hypothetical protein